MGADAAVEAAAKAAGEAHGAFIRWPMNDGIDRRGIVEQRVRDAYEDALAEQPREERGQTDPMIADRYLWVEWAVVSALTHFERVGLDPQPTLIASRVRDLLEGRTRGLDADDAALEHVWMPSKPAEEKANA